LPLVLKPSTVRRIYEEHNDYWSDASTVKEMERLSRAYHTRFWDEPDYDDKLTVQTSDAYAFIEGYQASLYAKNPAVVLKPGIRARGSADKSQSAANWWLKEYVRRPNERSSRRALIYPFSAVKLYPVEGEEDVFRRVHVKSLFPWECVVDNEADDWDEQRWVGHVYWMSLGEAWDTFGRRKDFVPAAKLGYFEAYEELEEQESGDDDDPVNQRLWGYVRVVELYCDGKRYFWSPHFKSGEKFVQAPDAVAFVNYADKPVVPIVPKYYNEDADEPLRGYSALWRIYDQVYEKNTIRTYKARGVRKTGRQHLWKKGAIDAEQRAQLETGEDGLNLEIDCDDVRTVCAAVPHTSMHAEVDKYAQDVQADMDKGSVLAPFTRGEATKATATEINALAAYTSSEVGRMARERDAFIERLVAAWLAMVALYLGEGEAPAENVSIDGESVNIRVEDLLGDFEFYAQDSAKTPLSEAAKKEETLALLPMLAELGVTREQMLKWVVGNFDLPESFVQGAVEDQPEARPAGPQEVPAAAAGGDADTSMATGRGVIPLPPLGGAGPIPGV